MLISADGIADLTLPDNKVAYDEIAIIEQMGETFDPNRMKIILQQAMAVSTKVRADLTTKIKALIEQ